MNPLVFEELRQKHEDEVSWYVGQLKLARDREARYAAELHAERTIRPDLPA
jgi:hypothetical protein